MGNNVPYWGWFNSIVYVLQHCSTKTKLYRHGHSKKTTYKSDMPQWGHGSWYAQIFSSQLVHLMEPWSAKTGETLDCTRGHMGYVHMLLSWQTTHWKREFTAWKRFYVFETNHVQISVSPVSFRDLANSDQMHTNTPVTSSTFPSTTLLYTSLSASLLSRHQIWVDSEDSSQTEPKWSNKAFFCVTCLSPAFLSFTSLSVGRSCLASKCHQKIRKTPWTYVFNPSSSFKRRKTRRDRSRFEQPSPKKSSNRKPMQLPRARVG